MAADRRISRHDHNLLALTGLCAAISARFDYADHRHMRASANAVERQRACGIAGDHQQLRTMLFEEVRSAHGVAGNGLRRLRAIRQTRSVAEVQIVGIGDHAHHLAQDG